MAPRPVSPRSADELLKYAIAQRHSLGTETQLRDPAWLAAQRDQARVEMERTREVSRELCGLLLTMGKSEATDPPERSFGLLKRTQKAIGEACDAVRDLAMLDRLLVDATGRADRTEGAAAPPRGRPAPSDRDDNVIDLRVARPRLVPPVARLDLDDLDS